jgi:hypothetical protein
VALALCCGVAAVPVIWFIRETAAAERGEVSPTAAVNVYVLQTSSGDEFELVRVLAKPRREELLRQWRAYQVEMNRGGRPSELEALAGDEVDQVDEDQAVVVTQVRAIWWPTDGSGLALHGTPHPWRFEVHKDRGGWRVWAVDPAALVCHRRQVRMT